VVNAPLVSAVIPAFNAEATLELAVASAVAQEPKPKEVLVVDDSSTDRTADVARELAELDPSIRLVPRSENGGPAAARRTGVHAASGDLIALLDADDVWLPGKLSLQLQLLRASDVDAVQAGKVSVDEELDPLRFTAARADQNEFEDFLRWRNLPGISSTLLARREAMSDALFCDDLPAIEDWAMALQLSRHHRIAAVPDPLALCRVHPTSRSHSIEAQIEAGHRILARMDEWGVDERLQRRAYAAFYVMLSGGALQLGQRKESLAWGRRALRRDARELGRLAGFLGRRARDRTRLARSGLSHAAIIDQTSSQLEVLRMA
jgi:glycosyltransferase involved in cell wall biosynthesis